MPILSRLYELLLLTILRLRRIGTAPSLSLVPASHLPATADNPMTRLPPNGVHAPPHHQQHLNRMSDFPDKSSVITATSPGSFNTTNGTINKGYQRGPGPDEFGYGRPDVKAAATAPARSNTYYQEDSVSPTSESRPSTGRRGTSNNRFTITNLGEDEHELHAASSQAPPLPAAQLPRAEWLSAEAEKKRLYEEASAKVARVQGSDVFEILPIDRSPVRP
jgi:hypothetical protein